MARFNAEATSLLPGIGVFQRFAYARSVSSRSVMDMPYDYEIFTIIRREYVLERDTLVVSS